MSAASQKCVIGLIRVSSESKLSQSPLHRVFDDKGEANYSIYTSVELFVRDEEHLREMYLWLSANNKHQFDLVFFSPIVRSNADYLYRILAWFANKSDATLFKITWKTS